VQLSRENSPSSSFSFSPLLLFIPRAFAASGHPQSGGASLFFPVLDASIYARCWPVSDLTRSSLARFLTGRRKGALLPSLIAQATRNHRKQDPALSFCFPSPRSLNQNLIFDRYCRLSKETTVRSFVSTIVQLASVVGRTAPFSPASIPVSRSPTVVPNLSTPQQQQSCNTTPTAQRFRSFFRCAHNVSLFSCSVPSLESRALLEGRPPISTISSFRNATTWAFRTIADLLQVILSERKHVGTPSTAGSLR
jgi:hypothetical protein